MMQIERTYLLYLHLMDGIADTCSWLLVGKQGIIYQPLFFAKH